MCLPSLYSQWDVAHLSFWRAHPQCKLTGARWVLVVQLIYREHCPRFLLVFSRNSAALCVSTGAEGVFVFIFLWEAFYWGQCYSGSCSGWFSPTWALALSSALCGHPCSVLFVCSEMNILDRGWALIWALPFLCPVKSCSMIYLCIVFYPDISERSLFLLKLWTSNIPYSHQPNLHIE